MFNKKMVLGFALAAVVALLAVGVIQPLPPTASPVAAQVAGDNEDDKEAADAVELIEAAELTEAAEPMEVAQAAAPNLERLVIGDFGYVGAFRLSAEPVGVSRTGYSHGVIGLGSGGESLYISGHPYDLAIGQFPLADPSPATSIAELPVAGPALQPFTAVVDRAPTGNPQGIDRFGGLFAINGSLLINGYEFYDAPADNSHTTMSVVDAANLSGSQVLGWAEMTGAAHSSGWMSTIPTEWRDALGGTHLSGNSSGIPIAARTSFGPSAFAVNLSGDLASVDQGAPLLDFSLDHPLHDDFFNGSGSNDLWTHLSRAVYGTIIPGTRTYLTVGHSGGHGAGVSYGDPPYGGYKGYYPNEIDDVSPHYWLWDLNDLVAVRSGSLAPHEVRPYDHGSWQLPFIEMAGNKLAGVGGASFDPATGRLYVSLSGVDYSQNQWEPSPVILVFELGDFEADTSGGGTDTDDGGPDDSGNGGGDDSNDPATTPEPPAEDDPTECDPEA